MDADDPRGHVTAKVLLAAKEGALSGLLDGLIDYAGLFPPAALTMRDAVQRFATYRQSEQRTMLARFVVPAARLEEFVEAAGSSERANDAQAWPLSVLATVADAPALDAFNAAHASRWQIDTVEAKAADVATIAALAAAFGGRFAVYVELPVREDPSPLIAALATHSLRAKIRTGGVTADAFPSPTEVVRFLAACHQHGVALKTTAGLHHPLRGEYPLTYDASSPRATMYGFLNVFLAAVLLHGGHSGSAVAPLLEERDPLAITVSPKNDAITWRGLRADTAMIVAARAQFAGAFGSCSFEEPVQDLTKLTLLPQETAR